jgi:hypothetical protein
MFDISLFGSPGSGKTVAVDYLVKNLDYTKYNFITTSYVCRDKWYRRFFLNILILKHDQNKPTSHVFDYIIMNDGTIENFYKKLDIVIRRGLYYARTCTILCSFTKVPRIFKNSKFGLLLTDVVRKLCSEFL